MIANPLNLPIGLQLYTVGKEMDSDPFGTLKQVAAIGYKEVELSPLGKVPPKDLRKALDDVDLKNPSGHYLIPDLMSNLQAKIDLAKEFGEEYMIATVPWIPDPSRIKMDPAKDQMGFFLDYHRIFSAARKAPIRAIYVEQEPPFTEMPALDAIKADYDYLKGLRV